MKPIAVFIVVAAFAVASVATQAKTVSSQQGNANETSVAAVAGPDKAAQNSGDNISDEKAAGKIAATDKVKKKAKSAPMPPEHHDPH